MTCKHTYKIVKDDLSGRYQDPDVRQILLLSCLVDPRTRELAWVSDKERKDVSRITVKPNLNYFSGPDPKDPEAIQQKMVEAKFSMPVVRQTDSILKKDKAE